MEYLFLIIIWMNPAVPEGTPPRRISACKRICKHRSAPPCLGEALRRGALIKLQGLMIFIIRVRTPGSCTFRQRAKGYKFFELMAESHLDCIYD